MVGFVFARLIDSCVGIRGGKGTHHISVGSAAHLRQPRQKGLVCLSDKKGSAPSVLVGICFPLRLKQPQSFTRLIIGTVALVSPEL